MSKKRINNHSKKANLQLFFNEIIRPLDEIHHIRAHIHRISFTTNYPYKRIAEKLGSEFQTKPISKHSRSRSSIYLLEGYTNFLDFKVHVMTGLIGSMLKSMPMCNGSLAFCSIVGSKGRIFSSLNA